ncbi:MAG TPA: flavin reductase family protein [Verrucomicrobium sp.]|nr:flavin reductase family protein [Verrucomicrobium sp.]
MTSSHLNFDPQAADLGFDPYDLLIHAVAPRPIAFVSTVTPDGKPNLAPFSFFMGGGSNPVSVCFSPCTKEDGSFKDTLRNIEATREFVIHTVTFEMAEGVVKSSRPLPYGSSEWPDSGFTPLPSLKVKPPRVAEAPFAMECRLHTVVHHGSGADAANYVIGEVVMFHVAEDLMRNDPGELEPGSVDYLARLGGGWYSRIQPESLFVMRRPTS